MIEKTITIDKEPNTEPLDWRQSGVLAKVQGELVLELPKDLYIPPSALRVFLETFEGPMDLLLYLIKKQNLDILDIPMAHISEQYMQYIDLMSDLEMELAGEYLVMAATLAEIKSRMLLPKSVNTEGEEEDPRADLVRRLQEYERFKKAAIELGELPKVDSDFHIVQLDRPASNTPAPLAPVAFDRIIDALKDVMARAKLFSHHHIKLESMSIRERMTLIVERLDSREFVPFETLFTAKEGRMGVVVTLIAILELVRNNVLELAQSDPFSPLYVKARASEESS